MRYLRLSTELTPHFPLRSDLTEPVGPLHSSHRTVYFSSDFFPSTLVLHEGVVSFHTVINFLNSSHYRFLHLLCLVGKNSWHIQILLNALKLVHWSIVIHHPARSVYPGRMCILLLLADSWDALCAWVSFIGHRVTRAYRLSAWEIYLSLRVGYWSPTSLRFSLALPPMLIILSIQIYKFQVWAGWNKTVPHRHLNIWSIWHHFRGVFYRYAFVCMGPYGLSVFIVSPHIQFTLSASWSHLKKEASRFQFLPL